MIQDERVELLKSRLNKGKYITYWMQGAQRIRYNHALEFAKEKAQFYELPLLVFFVLTDSYPEANLRHYKFMLEGIKEIKEEFEKIEIKFMIIKDSRMEDAVLRLSRESRVLVTDKAYLRMPRIWRKNISEKIDCDFYEVDTDLIIPVKECSDKEEYSAATIRKKIERKIYDYMFEFQESEYSGKKIEIFDKSEIEFVDVETVLDSLDIDRGVAGSENLVGGYSRAKEILDDFIDNKIEFYDDHSSNPSKDMTSYLSPYLHFGQISSLEIALKIEGLKGSRGFLEQLIVRRSLAFNFVYYNENYDIYEKMTYGWALETLDRHRDDSREFIYSLDEFENGKTHDIYWNAAQNEMIKTGFMHNYMRMYWAKKIIEWSETPEKAYKTIIYLNNRYFIDGRDPNSYTGVAWCFGKHDRAWKERVIFGKIRYMNANGLKRKFDMRDYLNRNS